MLNENHWIQENYVQRMTNKQWKTILLQGKDQIIFHGYLRKLKAKKLGYGVVEVYKSSLGRR